MIKIYYRHFMLLSCLALSGFVLLADAIEGFRLDRVIQTIKMRYGSNAVKVTTDWFDELSNIQKESEQNKLRLVDEYFNRKLHFETDISVWKQEDYWATPVESLIKEYGDCEDFAIAKYFTLKYAGVPVSKLRITYVKARIGGAGSDMTQAHMVLTYYATPDAEPLVLDNLVSEIRPASRRTDLTPIFSFNSEGVWAAGVAAPQSGSSSRLSKWTDLVEKMKVEGFE